MSTGSFHGYSRAMRCKSSSLTLIRRIFSWRDTISDLTKSISSEIFRISSWISANTDAAPKTRNGMYMCIMLRTKWKEAVQAGQENKWMRTRLPNSKSTPALSFDCFYCKLNPYLFLVFWSIAFISSNFQTFDKSTNILRSFLPSRRFGVKFEEYKTRCS